MKKIGLLIVILSIMSCAGGISKQVRSRVDYSRPFIQVRQEPEKFVGETVMWGGRIIDTRTKNKGTELMVLQLALDRQNRPKNNDKSQGRFIIQSPQFMDPAVYSPGDLITVVGTLRGSETRLIGDMSYQYPLLDMIEIKKWRENGLLPGLHFGVGIGAQF